MGLYSHRKLIKMTVMRRAIVKRTNEDLATMNPGTESPGQVIHAFLAAASRMWTVAPDEAERIYRQAVRLAETEAGTRSALKGLVLLDLMMFYEHQERGEEAGEQWKQIREVVVDYIEKSPELLSR